MSFITEVLHKITRKTPIICNSRYSSHLAIDSRTGIPRLQNQCIQPKEGMYSVLTIGDHLDVVVRYVKTLPYTLQVSSDEDCPQVTYVIPRQDMKAGDFFTLFVGREHFMVEVIQVLSKSDSNYGFEEVLDSDSSYTDVSIVPRTHTVQSNMNRHSGSLSPSTGRRQDRETFGRQPISTPVTKPLPARPNRREGAVFCTRTQVDAGKVRNPTRANASVVPAAPSNHPDRAQFTPVDIDPASHTFCDRPSAKLHQTVQTNPSTKLDINITLQGTSLSPLTNIQHSPRPESPQPPTHGSDKTTLDTFRATKDTGKVPKKSTAELSNVIQAEHTRQEHITVTKPRRSVYLMPSQKSPLAHPESDTQKGLGLDGT